MAKRSTTINNDYPATYQQRRALVRLTRDFSYYDKEMKMWEAGTLIRRLTKTPGKGERYGR